IITAGGGVTINDTEQRGDLKPEISNSIEFGTEWKFFNNRFGVDFTWYKTNTRNQLLRMNNPAGSRYKNRYVNAGKIRNQGFELTVDATPVMNDNFRWKTAINMSANKNKVVSLHPEYTQFTYYDEGFNMAYQMRVKEGGKLGDIYGNAFQRDKDGKVVSDPKTKAPVGNQGNNDLLGNANPDLMMGWGNTITYKGFSLYFLIDFRFGGDVMSLTQADLDSKGVTKNTGAARNHGSVDFGGNSFYPSLFYGTVGGKNGISEYYMYDATNIRLRELSLGYSFPRAMIEKTKFIKGLDLSLIARNLFFFKNNAPFDPDAVLSTGNNNQGVDVFGMPTTRNIGFNVKFTF
ncbi:MAG: TonB-dependent receptor, partial [Bacteroidaceae bacterium]